MNFSAAALRLMAEKGLTLEDVLEILRANEAARKPARQPDVIYAVGPRERWGYNGAITPRLPDRDWWPLRNAILERDGHACHYCGAEGPRMCADHVVPLSRGGTNEQDNLVACCGPCNVSKSDRLLSEWGGRA